MKDFIIHIILHIANPVIYQEYIYKKTTKIEDYTLVV